MEKQEVKKLLQDNGFKQWQLADALGISEYTLCKRLRRPLSEDFEAKVRKAIEDMKEARDNAEDS